MNNCVLSFFPFCTVFFILFENFLIYFFILLFFFLLILELSYKSVAAQVHKMFQRQKSGVKLKEITGWMNSMLERVEPNGKSIYDLSVEFHNQGRIVEIPSNNQGQIMLLASDGR